MSGATVGPPAAAPADSVPDSQAASPMSSEEIQAAQSFLVKHLNFLRTAAEKIVGRHVVRKKWRPDDYDDSISSLLARLWSAVVHRKITLDEKFRAFATKTMRNDADDIRRHLNTMKVTGVSQKIRLENNRRGRRGELLTDEELAAGVAERRAAIEAKRFDVAQAPARQEMEWVRDALLDASLSASSTVEDGESSNEAFQSVKRSRRVRGLVSRRESKRVYDCCRFAGASHDMAVAVALRYSGVHPQALTAAAAARQIRKIGYSVSVSTLKRLAAKHAATPGAVVTYEFSAIDYDTLGTVPNAIGAFVVEDGQFRVARADSAVSQKSHLKFA